MARFCGAFLCFGPLLYWTRAQLTQARSASDGTAPSLALRACVTPARAEGRPRRWRSGLVSLRPALSIFDQGQGAVGRRREETGLALGVADRLVGQRGRVQGVDVGFQFNVEQFAGPPP